MKLINDIMLASLKERIDMSEQRANKPEQLKAIELLRKAIDLVGIKLMRRWYGRSGEFYFNIDVACRRFENFGSEVQDQIHQLAWTAFFYAKDVNKDALKESQDRNWHIRFRR